MTQTPSATHSPRSLLPLALFAAALPAVLWAYWSTLDDMAHRWSTDPMYSHGYLVPLFAGALLWLRRGKFPADARPAWWGMGLIGVAAAVRLAGTWYHYAWLDPISLLPCLAGLFVLAGGWPLLRWALPAVGFLFFMIPLPYNLSLALSGKGQQVATAASTYALQTLGLPAVAEGNVILLNEVQMGIIDACSGLRMLVVFFALSTGLALVIRRPLWEKAVVVASSLPIAVVTNVIRITVTGVLHETVGSEIADAVFHDLAGWLMMPVALGFLGLELKVLGNLFLDPAAPAPAKVEVFATRATAPAPAAPQPAAGPAAPSRRSRRDRQPASKPFARQ
jgi:exosortase